MVVRKHSLILKFAHWFRFPFDLNSLHLLFSLLVVVARTTHTEKPWYLIAQSGRQPLQFFFFFLKYAAFIKNNEGLKLIFTGCTVKYKSTIVKIIHCCNEHKKKKKTYPLARLYFECPTSGDVVTAWKQSWIEFCGGGAAAAAASRTPTESQSEERPEGMKVVWKAAWQLGETGDGDHGGTRTSDSAERKM